MTKDNWMHCVVDSRADTENHIYMTQSSDNSPLPSRRQFLQNTGTIIGASALAGVTLPHVHAQGSDQVQVALVGCGGRGTGAAANALATSGPPKLVAMADVFQEKLTSSLGSLQKKFNDQVDVPKDRQFIGFDGYKHAMDSLKKGDVIILTTPVAFRWVHFKYAIEKGLNVFMEKPVCTDAVTGHRMLALNEEAKKKKLKVGVGLMVRHCQGARNCSSASRTARLVISWPCAAIVCTVPSAQLSRLGR